MYLGMIFGYEPISIRYGAIILLTKLRKEIEKEGTKKTRAKMIVPNLATFPCPSLQCRALPSPRRYIPRDSQPATGILQAGACHLSGAASILASLRILSYNYNMITGVPKEEAAFQGLNLSD
jgi:hypothetical protein